MKTDIINQILKTIKDRESILARIITIKTKKVPMIITNTINLIMGNVISNNSMTDKKILNIITIGITEMIGVIWIWETIDMMGKVTKRHLIIIMVIRMKSQPTIKNPFLDLHLSKKITIKLNLSMINNISNFLNLILVTSNRWIDKKIIKTIVLRKNKAINLHNQLKSQFPLKISCISFLSRLKSLALA